MKHREQGKKQRGLSSLLVHDLALEKEGQGMLNRDTETTLQALEGEGGINCLIYGQKQNSPF